MTSLHLAAQSGKVDAVRFLLETRKISVNVKVSSSFLLLLLYKLLFISDEASWTGLGTDILKPLELDISELFRFWRGTIYILYTADSEVNKK